MTMKPLSGFTVAVTADRRREDLANLLEREGARVVLAPPLRIVPVADDAELRATTLALIERPPGVLAANTALGIRGWFAAAEGWGLAEALRSALSGAYLVARGSRAQGALRAAGLPAAWSAESEQWSEIQQHLLARGVRGARVAVQRNGEAEPELTAALSAAGAEVVEVAAYRWLPPVDPTPLRRIVDLATNRLVDAIAFTCAPAAAALLSIAGPDAGDLLHAMRTDVLAACLGPVTAASLARHGVPVLAPHRARLGALVRALAEELPKRAPTLLVAGQQVTLRGHAAVVDGALRPLAPAPMAVLRALAAAPGRVLSRAALLSSLPRGADEHAVEMAVARLRAALGGSAYVQTVVKRGYRLRVD
ncbi:MAG: uroporphyrinogen-III synthase [Micromonosporaceae bacterium]|nr:uroporphyrinogen-III synthase [Micromonosporaceae bacterium]